MSDHLSLLPPLVEAGKFHELVDAGQTLSAILSPADNSLGVYITNLVCLTAPELSQILFLSCRIHQI